MVVLIMKKRKMKNHKKGNVRIEDISFENIYNKIKSNRVENYNWDVYDYKSLEDALYNIIKEQSESSIKKDLRNIFMLMRRTLKETF